MLMDIALRLLKAYLDGTKVDVVVVKVGTVRELREVAFDGRQPGIETREQMVSIKTATALRVSGRINFTDRLGTSRKHLAHYITSLSTILSFPPTH